jgi:hypothetical protein
MIKDNIEHTNKKEFIEWLNRTTIILIYVEVKDG